MPASHKMRPIILKGHDRPISQIMFNREGDLLFTTSRGKNPTVWFANNGERAGTFDGHTGAVFSLDVNYDSTRLITASGDQSTRMWDVQTGEQLFMWKYNVPSRFVNWATGDKMFLSVTDAVMKNPPYIYLYHVADDIKNQESEAFLTIKADDVGVKVNHAMFGPLNETIFATTDSGDVVLFNPKNGDETKRFKAHRDSITGLKFTKEQMLFATGSKDCSCKLWDVETLTCLKTFTCGRLIYDLAISPKTHHLMVSAGQDVATVTTQESSSGQFRVRVFHIVFQTEIASLAGHFSPINTLAFSRDGRYFASGGEDGFVRLFHLENSVTEGLSDEVVFPVNVD